MKVATIAASVGCAIAASSAHAQIPCGYEVAHVIQAPPAGTSQSPTYGMNISPDGHYVAGYYSPAGIFNDRAFVFDTWKGEFLTLPHPPGIIGSRANDVSDSGLVVGTYGGSIGDFGFIYDIHTGEYTNLPPQTLDGTCEIDSINASGVVCGRRSIDDGGDPSVPLNAFIWSPKNGFVDLGLMGDTSSLCRDISDQGIAVGNAGSLEGAVAFQFQRGELNILGFAPGALQGIAFAVDNEGRVLIGGATQFSPVLNVRYILSDGEFTPVLPLPGFNSLQAQAMNNNLVIVGNSNNTGSGNVPTVWFNFVPLNLNDLTSVPAGLHMKSGMAVADEDSILVSALNSGDDVAVVLTPVKPGQGDTDCDQDIDVDDLLNVINNWGACEGCTADITSDGTVNANDLMIVIENWSAAA